MLACIAKILKRGKRKRHKNGKKSPWSLPQPGIFHPRPDTIGRAYDYEVSSEILKKMVKKDNRGPILRSTR